MRTYATAQQLGTRSHQCDATAVFTAPTGARAYVLLDGIGSNDGVRDWTRDAARRLARTAARHGDAEAGLRAVYNAYAAEEDRRGEYTSHMPKAAAVVAVTVPGKPLTVAWCGDSRAYVLTSRGTVQCLTNDHNLRRVFPPRDGRLGGNRNLITSCLGSSYTDDELMYEVGHPAIEAATRPAEACRLLLASDGAYEPILDNDARLETYLTGTPAEVAADLTEVAVAWSGERADNATALVADLRP